MKMNFFVLVTALMLGCSTMDRPSALKGVRAIWAGDIAANSRGFYRACPGGIFFNGTEKIAEPNHDGAITANEDYLFISRIDGIYRHDLDTGLEKKIFDPILQGDMAADSGGIYFVQRDAIRYIEQTMEAGIEVGKSPSNGAVAANESGLYKVHTNGIFFRNRLTKTNGVFLDKSVGFGDISANEKHLFIEGLDGIYALNTSTAKLQKFDNTRRLHSESGVGIAADEHGVWLAEPGCSARYLEFP